MASRRGTGEGSIYERLVRCHIVPHLGHVKLVDLTPRTINRAYAAMLEGGLAASSVIKVHQVLRSALSAAVRDGVLVANPSERATPPAVPRTEVEPLTLGQVRAILADSEGTADQALWAVFAGGWTAVVGLQRPLVLRI